tara:strand:- start:1176 stop:2684 length:1509 start_codon:yes stop_codon:yes gene_type:complete
MKVNHLDNILSNTLSKDILHELQLIESCNHKVNVDNFNNIFNKSNDITFFEENKELFATLGKLTNHCLNNTYKVINLSKKGKHEIIKFTSNNLYSNNNYLDKNIFLYLSKEFLEELDLIKNNICDVKGFFYGYADSCIPGETPLNNEWSWAFSFPGHLYKSKYDIPEVNTWPKTNSYSWPLPTFRLKTLNARGNNGTETCEVFCKNGKGVPGEGNIRESVCVGGFDARDPKKTINCREKSDKVAVNWTCKCQAPDLEVNGTYPNRVTIPPFTKKILVIGGGHGESRWDDNVYAKYKNKEFLEELINKGWDGVCWDWEEIASGHTTAGFHSFMKEVHDFSSNGKSLINMISTTPLGPYHWDSTSKSSEIKWDNIHYIIPMMYGVEGGYPGDAKIKKWINFWNGKGQDANSTQTGLSWNFEAIDSSRLLWGISPHKPIIEGKKKETAGTPITLEDNIIKMEQAMQNTNTGASGYVLWAYNPRSWFAMPWDQIDVDTCKFWPAHK